MKRTCDKYASSLHPDQPIGNVTSAKSEMPYQAEFTPNPSRPTEHDIEMGGAAHDENEETRPIFTPTAKSRVVRIVQKHTNETYIASGMVGDLFYRNVDFIFSQNGNDFDPSLFVLK